MKTTAKVINANCDFCGQKALYDGPTKQGPWAYMCEGCFNQHSTKAESTLILRGVAKQASDEYLIEPSLEEIEEMLYDGIALAACKHGCETEPDGYCPHGKPAWPLKLGYI